MEDAELPIQHGGTLSAEDQKKPLSVTSCLLPACSLRSTAAVAPAAHAESQAAGDLCIRSLSFSKLLSFRMARAPSSLSTSEYIDQIDPETPGNSSTTKEEEEKLKQICRSQSVPTSGRLFKVAKGLRRVADSSSLGPAPAGVFRLRLVPLVPQTEASATAAAGEEEASAEDIAAEEAVCRICMVALSEEAVLKLECCCKGELALAHRGCAIKWFSIKGNGTCDVCSQEVLNLPVTLRRLHHHPSIQAQHQADPTTTATSSRRYRVWHGTPILVIISMLAYFCFLEQLLVACLLHLRSLRLPGHCIILSSVLPDPTNEPPNYIHPGRRPWDRGSGHLFTLRLRPRPLLLSHHNKDGVQEICVDLLCSAVPLHCALHPPLLQIRKILSVVTQTSITSHQTSLSY
ncbi:hypothetical protein PVAP13_1NG006300 [Panicum virgatum]|uniref:RING-CH-type domain-containing protein n=1 Tax=Panicum virgatum TaxID=38727 RepID=A0A8T0WRU8_PANVG|nr:hypothetical protein PVAP13_1NG006300 [Panicum virgatum]KAG2647854.1 hypothetical protein PVAP13_1NG006300 [Panicum virgatum]